MFHLLQLSGDVHHHRLQLLLFKLQSGQIALELLQTVFLYLQLVFCEFNCHRRTLIPQRSVWAIFPG